MPQISLHDRVAQCAKFELFDPQNPKRASFLYNSKPPSVPLDCINETMLEKLGFAGLVSCDNVLVERWISPSSCDLDTLCYADS